MTPGTTKWWSSLRHGGLLIAPSRLGLLRASEPEPISSRLAERLRAEVIRLGTQNADAQRELLDTVLEHVCDLQGQDGARWVKGNDVPAAWSRRAATGEMLKPRRLWLGPNGSALPVFVDHEPRLGVGRGRRPVSRVLEWLRASDSRIALLTNHSQFRLIYAGADYDAWAEWDTSLWFEEGAPSAQVDALRWLIGRESVTVPAPGKRCTLVEAIEESRKGQSELSASLGERVRRAVEHLIQAYGERLAELPAEVSARDIYVAATRVVMRMVVVLFAEARELLPRDNPLYEASYGLQALRAHLDRATGASRQRRSFHAGAWPRILGMFRLVHDGSHHPELLIRRYGGGLFASGSAGAVDPIARALAVFEDPEHGPNDEIVARILDLLCRTEMRVRIGNRFRSVSAPVDFSDLSSEYIGILYEGLLDYELRRAAADDPLVFLDLGDQPVLPLSRLEAMSDGEIKGLVEKVKKSRKAVAGGENEDEDERSGADDGEDDEDQGTSEVIADEEALDELTDIDGPIEEDEPETEDDRAFVIDQRAHEWAVRAVKAGGLITKSRSKRPDVIAQYEEQVAATARQLVTRVVQPGEWFLVLWGGTRKGSGTFYTRPQLAVPTVHRTIHPLAYFPPAERGDAPAAEWTPKSPEAILSLKVCDPAAGSGSFLVAALRFLAEALWRSILHQKWLAEEGDRFVVTATGTELPTWFAECVRDLPVTAGEAEAHIRARLRRVVVERCLYGVDLDPLAIDLARLALWVETMDRNLPFEFLDHRLKVGNALVGCWFDSFRDYPAMAWMREGGDADHDNFVHHFRTYRVVRGKNKGEEQRVGDKWTNAIKGWRDSHVRPALANWIVGQSSLLRVIDGQAPETLHQEAVNLLRRMENIPLHDPDERARFYRQEVQQHPAFQHLVTAFDTWCAVWFWPADELASAPMPADFGHASGQTLATVKQLQRTHRFFHWELEFADVFAAQGSGFDAIVGNPPWETLQPNSKEFFSNIDPLYRTYGRPQAGTRQRELFASDARHELDWLAYSGRFKQWVNWYQLAHSPYGDPDEGSVFSLGAGAKSLHPTWRARRQGRVGFADPQHAFRRQGGGKPYTYKMFLEQSHSLLKPGGRLGMILPSGVYTDKESAALRDLMLDRCRWEWIFGFENRSKIFDIHRSFKFCSIVLMKDGRTEAVRTAFMRYEVEDWENAEKIGISYPRKQVIDFSPKTRAILEVQDARDLAVLEAIYSRATLLSDVRLRDSPIEFRRDFNMTDDAAMFPNKTRWEQRGFRPDGLGRWTDGSAAIALPLSQGSMLWHFDCAFQRWQDNRWRPGDLMTLEPKYLLDKSDLPTEDERLLFGFRDITGATNQRTAVAALLPALPSGNTIGLLVGVDPPEIFRLLAEFNSFVFDWTARKRIGGTHLNWFIGAELPVVLPNEEIGQLLDSQIRRLAMLPTLFAPFWIRLGTAQEYSRRAFAPHERLRIRCAVDAVVAALYGLSWDGLSWILRDCDLAPDRVRNNSVAGGLDPKGFWRVDKHVDPELRHSVLTLVAFHDLQQMIAVNGGNRDVGIASFCGANDGDGWMLPETLRLADYGLGRDDRANQQQPVRSRLGERYYPWQVEQNAEESWAVCEKHARNLLGPEGYARLQAELAQTGTGTTKPPPAAAEDPKAGSAQRRLFPGEPTLFGDKTEDPV